MPASLAVEEFSFSTSETRISNGVVEDKLREQYGDRLHSFLPHAVVTGFVWLHDGESAPQQQVGWMSFGRSA